MATVSLTDNQVLELVKQLPEAAKRQVLIDLSAERDQWWNSAAMEGEVHLRQIAAQRGFDWDRLSEEEREKLVDDILHEP